MPKIFEKNYIRLKRIYASKQTDFLSEDAYEGALAES